MCALVVYSLVHTPNVYAIENTWNHPGFRVQLSATEEEAER